MLVRVGPTSKGRRMGAIEQQRRAHKFVSCAIIRRLVVKLSVRRHGLMSVNCAWSRTGPSSAHSTQGGDQGKGKHGQEVMCGFFGAPGKGAMKREQVKTRPKTKRVSRETGLGEDSSVLNSGGVSSDSQGRRGRPLRHCPWR